MVGMGGDHQNHIAELKCQIKGHSKALHPDNDRNRDIGGKKNKFDHEKIRYGAPAEKEI